MKLAWSLAVKIATFALLSYCGIRVIFDGFGWFGTVAVGFIMVISFPLSAIAHELGHMLFGAAVKITAEPDERFLRNAFMSWGESSSCKLIPRTDNALRGRVIFTALGGAALNAIFIILGLVALCVPAIPIGLCALLPASFHLLAMNVAPFNYEDGKSDGKIIVQLLRNDDEARVMLAVLKVQAQVCGGKPISEIDEKLLFDLPQIREDDQSFIALVQLRYEYFSAKGDAVNAEIWHARLEELKRLY